MYEKVYQISLGGVRFGKVPTINEFTQLPKNQRSFSSENCPHLPFATGSSSFEETCVFCKICIPWRCSGEHRKCWDQRLRKWCPAGTGCTTYKSWDDPPSSGLWTWSSWLLHFIYGSTSPNRRMMEGSWHSNCRFSFVRIWPVAGPKNGVICWLWGGKQNNWQSSCPPGNEKTYPTKQVETSENHRLKFVPPAFLRGYVIFPF